jgi:hypothetical protein
MVIVRFIGQFAPQEIGAHHVLFGKTGITLYDEHGNYFMNISYNLLISIYAE